MKYYKPEDKFAYHNHREHRPGSYGIKFNSPKHMYSIGFGDGFSGTNNTSAITKDFGKKAGFAYSQGYKRGRKNLFKL